MTGPAGIFFVHFTRMKLRSDAEAVGFEIAIPRSEAVADRLFLNRSEANGKTIPNR
jgi:hypothetical protein